MNKVLLLLLAVSLNGVASEEVGAPYPQLANSAHSGLAVAVAETGASTRWAAQPSVEQSKTEAKEFEIRVEGLDVKLNQELDTMISHKLDSLLAKD